MECTYPRECFVNHVGSNAMIDHVDGTMMAPRFIELTQVFLALIPGTGMDSLEVHDGDASGLHGFLADSHVESSADEDES